MVFNTTRKNFLRESRLAKRQRAFLRGSSTSKKQTLVCPTEIFRSAVSMCTDLATHKPEDAESHLLINSHQLKARRSNPNSRITISKPKKRSLLKKLQLQGLLLDVNLKKPKKTQASDPYDFLTRIVPVSNGVGTSI
jgi:hypothetical protein